MKFEYTYSFHYIKLLMQYFSLGEVLCNVTDWIKKHNEIAGIGRSNENINYARQWRLVDINHSVIDNRTV